MTEKQNIEAKKKLQKDLELLFNKNPQKGRFLPHYDLIVDGETISVYSSVQKGKMIIPKAMFNIGMTLAHKDKILLQQQAQNTEFWLYPEHKILDFYRHNFTEADFTHRYSTFKDYFQNWFEPMLKGLKDTAKVVIWSYNAAFDRAAFMDNCLLEGIRINRQILNNWKCIMILATKLLARDMKFHNWCIEKEYEYANREYITSKGNFKTSAEIVYRYLTLDVTFVEAHKGLEDSEIEHKILQWCKEQRGWSKIDATPIGGGWRNLNSHAEPFQRMGEIQLMDWDGITIANQDKLAKIMKRNNMIRG